MKKIFILILTFVLIISLCGCDNGGGYSRSCNRCGGDGKVECYKCNGLGQYYNGPLGNWYRCGICMGKGYHYCSECDN